ncbi:LacI family transcriptional regulator [Sphingomonas oleivorans]|uniref:LacI family transcriptional regulator n=1 Tax=Sphingomonas oleivorans TaxID=1735121 RepID=A0A2T5G0R5_9SPHN|nr:LacI family DNA-binding transcriptional regulator [Sphingomonas oleivorans]PTQ12732.1 LacI family transcriptional regulator [Sphingomonas oleivorans]
MLSIDERAGQDLAEDQDKPRDPSRPPTMADIAKLAGVTAITVSRALKDNTVVALETRERIRRIAAEQGYRLNVDARRLRLKRSHTIAVIVDMRATSERPMSGPYPLGLIGGILQRLSERRYSMLLTTLKTLDRDGIGHADGAILLGQGANDAAVQLLEQYSVPFVVWGAGHGGRNHVFVGSDNIEAGKTVAARFYRQGRTAPLFLGDPDYPEISDRFDGFASAFDGREVRLVRCAFDFAEARRKIGRLLDAGEQVDAILAANDLMAAGALRAATDRGLNVPEQLSIVGFDDSPVALTTEPPLTSVAQNWSEGGLILADRILAVVAGKRTTSHSLPTALVERQT